MTADALLNSAQSESSPPAELSLAQKALWFAKANQWDAAHDLTNDIPDPEGAWIHAYLHREEGDLGNASYWYHRAHKEMPSPHITLDEEWHQIASTLS